MTAPEADTPFISVAIPTFRRPGQLSRAIRSVIAQTYENWEVVVSDDDAPGGESRAMVLALAQDDLRVRLIENRSGQGQVANTNNALLASRGRWIKLLHDDDWLAPTCLEQFARAAQAHPKAAFMTCTLNVVGDNGVKVYTRSNRRPYLSVYSSEESLEDLYLARTTRAIGIVPSTLMIRGELAKTGCLMRTYRSVTWGVDQLLFMDLARRGEMVLIRDGLVFYDATSHDNVTSTKCFTEIDRETIALKNLAWSFLKNRQGVPRPETVVGALRLARLRNRARAQPWSATVQDASCLLHPSVLALAVKSGLHLMRSERRDFTFVKAPAGALAASPCLEATPSSRPAV